MKEEHNSRLTCCLGLQIFSQNFDIVHHRGGEHPIQSHQQRKLACENSECLERLKGLNAPSTTAKFNHNLSHGETLSFHRDDSSPNQSCRFETLASRAVVVRLVLPHQV